jgi:hypothetical protein
MAIVMAKLMVKITIIILLLEYIDVDALYVSVSHVIWRTDTPISLPLNCCLVEHNVYRNSAEFLPITRSRLSENLESTVV